jgi:hypothetical protein
MSGFLIPILGRHDTGKRAFRHRGPGVDLILEQHREPSLFACVARCAYTRLAYKGGLVEAMLQPGVRINKKQISSSLGSAGHSNHERESAAVGLQHGIRIK